MKNKYKIMRATRSRGGPRSPPPSAEEWRAVAAGGVVRGDAEGANGTE